MALVSKADVSPPPYHLTPDVTPTVSLYEDRRYKLRVESNLKQFKVDSGEFLSGTLTIHALADVEQNITLSLTIWNRISTYTSKHKFLSRRSILHQSSMSKLNRAVIPLSGPFKRGLSYTIPFSIQFPESGSLPSCKCAGSIHSATPPSCNTGDVHVEYHLTSIVRHFSKRCWQSFSYKPSNLTLDLSNFYDEQGKSLMRMHTSPMSTRLTASAWPVANAPMQSSGYIRVYVQGPARVNSIRTSIVQCTATNPKGFGNAPLKDGSCQTKKISTNTIQGSWVANDGQIDIPYELPRKPLSPSHVGCYIAVLYFFKVELVHGQGVCSLTVPLILRCCESVPEYPAPELPAKVPVKEREPDEPEEPEEPVEVQNN